MAYTTKENVVREIRGLVVAASDTVVTEVDLESWIEQSDAYINGRLSSFYITPITGPESLKILKTISTYKVAHRVKNKLELTLENSDKRQEVQANLDKQAERMLDQLLPKVDGDKLRDPILKLPDAEVIPRSPDTGAISSYQKNQTAVFIKNGNNW